MTARQTPSTNRTWLRPFSKIVFIGKWPGERVEDTGIGVRIHSIIRFANRERSQPCPVLEVAYQHVDRSLNEQDPDGHLMAELKKKIKRRWREKGPYPPGNS